MSAEKKLTPYRLLAPSAGVKVSPFCLGAMTFGDVQPEIFGECSNETAFEILDYFYEQGGNFIDTANVYQKGASEELLGRWMKERGNRDEIVLATKYTSTLDFDAKVNVNNAGNSLKSMRVSVETSLKRLQTSYIDLLYVHWWDYTTSIPEMMQGLNDLVTSGKVLYLGISDTPAYIVTSANEYARANGLRPFSVYQGLWSASRRDFEREVIPMCLMEGMARCPWGTLGQGRFQTAAKYEEREKTGEGRKGKPTSPEDKAVSLILEKLADKRGVTLHAILLAYHLQKVPYVFPIVGARKVEHISSNLTALSITLTQEEVDEIESAYTFDYGFPHTFLSGSLFVTGKSRNATNSSQVQLLKSMAQPTVWVDAPKAIAPQ